MILFVSIHFSYRLDPGPMYEAIDKARRKVFAIAAARIRKRWLKLIVRRRGPSPPGRPPHTHRGAFFRRAVRFFAHESGAVIGPRASVIGPIGGLMEFGGVREGQVYPPRPSAGPALASYLDEYPKEWANSIGP